MRSAGRKRGGRGSGCGFLLATCVVTCIFLVFNSALVIRYYPWLAAGAPGFLGHPRVTQMAMFVAPVVLVFLEWWLVDVVTDLVTPKRRGR